MRGLAKSGRPGPVRAVDRADRESAAAAGAPKPTFTATALTLEWAPPPAVEGETAPLAFNVYRVAPKPDPAAASRHRAAAAAGAKPEAPLNPAPLTVAKLELPGVTMGTEQCFAVRAVHVVQNVAIESVASPTACVTPKRYVPAGAAAEPRAAAAGWRDRTGVGRRNRSRISPVTPSCAARHRVTHCGR